MFLAPVGVRDQMVLVVRRHQVLQDRARLEDLELHAVGCFVGDGWDASVGVDLHEPRLLLLVLEQSDWHQL